LPTAAVLGLDLPWPVRMVLVVAASIACARLARRSDLTLGAVVGAIAAVSAVAVVRGPLGSHDVWSYVEYGRMLGLHGANPYAHAPSQFQGDPFLHLVDWQQSPSVYGPAFTVFSAVGALVAGPSVVLARMWHQVGAALALAVALGVVWRRTADPRALVWLGLHPLVVIMVVNGGHNDLLVGVAVMLAVVALESRRDARSGVAVATGVLVKVTAGLAGVGAVIWAGSRRASRAAVVVAAAAVVVVLGYLPFGLQPFRALSGHSSLVSRASLWQLPHAVFALPVADVLHAHRLLGGVTVVVVAVLVASRRRHDDTAALALGGSLSSYQAVAPYVLPWYAAWSLPALALRRDAPLARWAWWYAAATAAIYQLPIHAQVTLGGWEPFVVGALFPAVALVTFVVAVWEPRQVRVAGVRARMPSDMIRRRPAPRL
jgi:hypothetical protein